MKNDSRTLVTPALGLLLGAAALLGGCSSAPEATQTGFISSYAKLQPVNDSRMRYVSPAMKNYKTFIIDPVQMSSEKGAMKPEDRAEVANYFRESLTKVLKERGYGVTDKAGHDVARIRLAMTNVNESKWWMKVHPASSLAGAGRAGAAMEGEVIDSVTGEQLAAVVQSSVGSQFTVGNFSTVADVKNIIDSWAKNAGDRLDEIRGGPKA